MQKNILKKKQCSSKQIPFKDAVIKTILVAILCTLALSCKKETPKEYVISSRKTTNPKERPSLNNDKKEPTQLYSQLEKMKRGKWAPKFVDYKNYKGGTSSLDDFKGTYIYIDVWAFWCSPCIAEFPALKKIEKQYHGRNIRFVGISLDPEVIWLKMVEKYNLNGVQLLGGNKTSSFKEDYYIKTIPRFILIDPEGKIVDAHAPKPSDPKLLDLFNELGI